MANKKVQKKQRHLRARKKVEGTELVPRLSIFRSGKHIYAQIIDDSNMKTIVSASDTKLKNKSKTEDKSIKVSSAFAVGEEVASKALSKKVKKVVFDTGGNKYHGRVKALADGARKGGLNF